MLWRNVYEAMETHCHFGLVNGGETSAGGICRVILHVPKRNRGYAMDIKQGDIIYANNTRGKAMGGRFEVACVSRNRCIPHRYA